MDEIAEITGTVPTFRDEIAKVVLSAVVGYGATRITQVAYDKFVVQRRHSDVDTDDE